MHQPIVVGRVYMTKARRKARIYAVDGGGDYSIHGAVERLVDRRGMTSDGTLALEWCAVEWTDYGAANVFPHEDDLVGEYADDGSIRSEEQEGEAT